MKTPDNAPVRPREPPHHPGSAARQSPEGNKREREPPEKDSGDRDSSATREENPGESKDDAPG